jgi:hypothetical protein
MNTVIHELVFKYYCFTGVNGKKSAKVGEKISCGELFSGTWRSSLFPSCCYFSGTTFINLVFPPIIYIYIFDIEKKEEKKRARALILIST